MFIEESFNIRNKFDMENILRKILLLDYIKDGHALEFQNSCIKIVIGALLLLIGPLTFQVTPEMYRFVDWIPARIWGLIFILLGSAHQFSLFAKYKETRKTILLIAGGIWVWFASSLIFGAPSSPAGYIYMVFAISTFRCYLCIRFFRRFDIHETLQ